MVYRAALNGSSQVVRIWGEKLCSAVGKQNTTFSLYITQPGRILLVQLCTLLHDYPQDTSKKDTNQSQEPSISVRFPHRKGTKGPIYVTNVYVVP